MKKTNILQTYWIILYSCCITLWFSFLAIYLGRFGTKDQMDNLVLRTWSRKLLSAVKLSYRVVKPQNFELTPNRAYIFMSNHASLYDIPLILLCMPGRVRMIAKKELMRVPMWGQAMKTADFVFIDRGNSAQAIKDLALAKEKMEHGVVIWMAPEGTRSKDGKLHIFKKGGFMLALETEAIIVPVGIRGANKILPAKTLKFSLGQEVEVHIGEPIDTKEYSVKTRNELIKKVRGNIAQLANIELA